MLLWRTREQGRVGCVWGGRTGLHQAAPACSRKVGYVECMLHEPHPHGAWTGSRTVSNTLTRWLNLTFGTSKSANKARISLRTLTASLLVVGRLLQRMTRAKPSTTWNTVEYGFLSRGGGWGPPLAIPCLIKKKKRKLKTTFKKMYEFGKETVTSKAYYKHSDNRAALAQGISMAFTS